MEPAQKTDGPKRTPKSGESSLAALKITREADRKRTTHTKKLKVGKGEYASAAILYFAETGLNPMKERPYGLANVTAKVSQEMLAVRELNVEIGQRLISIMRGWEKTLYGFLQQQQAGTLNYLQQIESNVLAHQVEVETSYLAPMVEQLFKVNLEAYITRGFASQLFVKASDLPAGSAEKQMELSTNGRDQQLVAVMRKFIKMNSVAKPKLSPKPQVPAIPAKAPSVPAGGAPVTEAPQK